MNLNFVYDKKTGEILAPRIVASHTAAVRDYIAMCDDKKAMFVRFPDDYLCVTFGISFSIDKGIDFSSKSNPDKTEFVEIVGAANGE